MEEAQRLVLERVRPLPPERIRLDDAAGRFLAEPAVAVVDLPPFDSSAMDGFAVRAADTPGRLPVGFRIAAGRPAPRSLEPGEAMAIATGGAVPEGADAVIPIEYVVEHDNDEIEIEESVEPGAFVRPRGGDARRGAEVVEAGIRLGPGHLGALAAAGVAEVATARRPRAAVLTTGSELRTPGEELEPGQIYEANGVILAAQLASAGAVVDRLSAVADEESAHREALARGAGGGRAGHVRGRFGRPARPRARGGGRARDRGGLLARRREAGQAALVRRARSERSCSGSRGTRCRPSCASSCSSGRRCWRCRASRDPRTAVRGRARSPPRSAETVPGMSWRVRARRSSTARSRSSRCPARSRT